MKITELTKHLLEDPKFADEWYKPMPGMEIALLRRMKGLTQKQLAKKLGMKQSHISRFENDKYLPSLMTLHKIARALGYVIKIDFVAENSVRNAI